MAFFLLSIFLFTLIILKSEFKMSNLKLKLKKIKIIIFKNFHRSGVFMYFQLFDDRRELILNLYF